MVRTPETLPIRAETDVVRVRQAVREWARELGFSLVEQTKVVTAASEIARNTLDHGGGGQVVIDEVSERERPGLRLRFEDEGAGIPDIDRAMRDGFTTGGGLGLGLGGTRRLVSDFQIESEPGRGTKVTITRWK